MTADPPPSVGARARNRFLDDLKLSYARGEAYTEPVTSPADLKRVVRAIRRAGELADLGVSIRRRTLPGGTVLVTFQAKDKRPC